MPGFVPLAGGGVKPTACQQCNKAKRKCVWEGSSVTELTTEYFDHRLGPEWRNHPHNKGSQRELKSRPAKRRRRDRSASSGADSAGIVSSVSELEQATLPPRSATPSQTSKSRASSRARSESVGRTPTRRSVRIQDNADAQARRNAA